MEKKDKVSIIVTVRNEEKNIPILLDGLLKQTYKFDEIVINDNGSTDKSIEIIRGYQSQYKCIKLIESGGRSIGEGRNTAIANSCGSILAVIDAGIYPEKTWLERVIIPLLENPDLDVVWGHVIFDIKSRIVPSTNLSKALVFLAKHPEDRKNGRNVPSSAFRRKVWEELGGFPEIQLPIEDLFLIDTIEKMGYKVEYANDANAYYFSYPDDYHTVFRKWIVSACSSFVAKKSELGFFRQFFIFGLFFFSILLIMMDIRMIIFALLYIILFLAYRSKLNMELAKEVFTSPRLFITVLKLFFILNFARLLGVIRALSLFVRGRQPKLIQKHRTVT